MGNSFYQFQSAVVGGFNGEVTDIQKISGRKLIQTETIGF